MLGILGLNGGDLVELGLDRVPLKHLADEVISKLVRHHHVHVIRGHCADAKLHIVPVFSDVAGQLRRISLSSLLLLQMTRVLAGCLAQSAKLLGLCLMNLCVPNFGQVG